VHVLSRVVWDEQFRFPFLEDSQAVKLLVSDELFLAGEISVPALDVFRQCVLHGNEPQWIKLRGVNAGDGQILVKFDHPDIPARLSIQFEKEAKDLAESPVRTKTKKKSKKARKAVFRSAPRTPTVAATPFFNTLPSGQMQQESDEWWGAADTPQKMVAEIQDTGADDEDVDVWWARKKKRVGGRRNRRRGVGVGTAMGTAISTHASASGTIDGLSSGSK
jgi:hypothetical protein